MGIGTGIVIVAVALACGANWWARADERRRMETISKPIATIAIAALALLLANDSVTAGARVAASIGFALCLAGDVALLPAVDRFVIGLASFLGGHLAFVAMFAILGLDRWWLGLGALIGVVVVAATVGRRIVSAARDRQPSLGLPVQVYLTIISLMAVAGWATGRPAAIVGSALFVLSDSILGWRQFIGAQRWMPVAVMITYHGALVGIALSLAG